MTLSSNEISATAATSSITLDGEVNHRSAYPYHYKYIRDVILATHKVPWLEQLVGLRKEGWRNEGLDEVYMERQAVIQEPDMETQRFWFEQMRRVMSELDHFGVGLVPPAGEFKFLDIGCAPGGFSSYILTKNRQAHGTGVTLDIFQGGYPVLLEKRCQRRYTLVLRDLLQLDFTYDGAPPPVPLVPIPPSLRDHQYVLVLVDGHHLRHYRPESPSSAPDAPSPPYMAFRDAFFLSQLLLALDALRPGGTLVLKLTHAEYTHTAQILFFLDAISDRLALCKPRVLHRSRATFYAVARGVHVDRAPPGWVSGLRALWREARFGGEVEGMGRALRAGELDFIVSPGEIVEVWLDRLVKLARQVWGIQVRGLQKLFERTGVQPGTAANEQSEHEDQ
ncbi:uncharacterized protein BXZ73DRAFT_76337 [Epithele typhae]|uniref:uncharacterized protein n=1 Tax=Epithele typhae TaxID=378194 RepID=UPI002008D629|nr:uncharacterized protein BXZ73DRAFT_76337 [Epithele typhae]KAH9938834.1 hypothetical protein BXZ73DRAFT_76337 [Epithele typhae]